MALRIHKIDFAQIEHGLSSTGSGSGSLPAEFELSNPGAGEPAFQFQPEFPGTIVKRDFEHDDPRIERARAVPEWDWRRKKEIAAGPCRGDTGACPNTGIRASNRQENGLNC